MVYLRLFIINDLFWPRTHCFTGDNENCSFYSSVRQERQVRGPSGSSRAFKGELEVFLAVLRGRSGPFKFLIPSLGRVF